LVPYNIRNFISFQSEGNNRYTVTAKNVKYFFGSADEVRFAFNEDNVSYDRRTGKSLSDSITVLDLDIKMSVLGQKVESDGYADDYAVEVSSIDPTNKELILDVDFFKTIVGTNKYLFLKTFTDTDNLIRRQIVDGTTVVSRLATKAAIETARADYADGQVFYATLENKFYASTRVNDVQSLVEDTTMTMVLGKGNLPFKYRHFTNDSGRFDPSSSNIIDLYIVTQSYNDLYRNWLRDTSGTVEEPTRPTMQELHLQYSELENYKMISDTLIMNSVVFKQTQH
jgi:hypothetical protein